MTVSSGNTVDNTHEYCIDWKEDTLTWSIDGDEKRTLERKSTWNSTSNRFDYPQTPARVMLSLWPAGLSTNDKGTVEWAGGEIDWHSQYMDNGYYYARFHEVTVECYDPPDGAQIKGKKTYKYTDKAGTNNTVAITDDSVILGSLLGTGEDPGEAAKSGDSTPTQSVAMVPGGNPGGGNRAEATTAASQATDGSSSQATDQVQGGDTQTTFNQGGSSSGTGAGSSLEPGLGRMGGSVLAIVVAPWGQRGAGTEVVGLGCPFEADPLGAVAGLDVDVVCCAELASEVFFVRPARECDGAEAHLACVLDSQMPEAA